MPRKRVDKNDWGPAKRIARKFFGEIGLYQDLGFEDSPALWDGKVVHASSPANLLHEVAHFQIAPEWRRFVHGYGLGTEPEGGVLRMAPLLVDTVRAFKEEAMASTLGIWWEIHLGYENWSETASDHSWTINVDSDIDLPGFRWKTPETPKEFLQATKFVSEKLVKLGVLSQDLAPQPVLAPSWRHSSVAYGD